MLIQYSFDLLWLCMQFYIEINHSIVLTQRGKYWDSFETLWHRSCYLPGWILDRSGKNVRNYWDTQFSTRVLTKLLNTALFAFEISKSMTMAVLTGPQRIRI